MTVFALPLPYVRNCIKNLLIMMKRPVTKEEMLLKMAGLCARSEQCEADIIQKLYAKCLPAADIQWVLSELRDRKFLDNARYAVAYARDKVRFAAWGRLKIRAGLAAKRITGPEAEKALTQIEDSDYEAAIERAAKAKAASLDMSKREDQIKLYRHLLSRGFESSLAAAQVRKQK